MRLRITAAVAALVAVVAAGGMAAGLAGCAPARQPGLRPDDLPRPSPTAIKARVERAVDGDTLKLAGGERVRLIGVNTPESVDPRRPVQAYGKEAAAFTARLVKGREVRLESDVEKVDRYGRTLAYVWLADGTFLNAVLVREGYAQVMTIPPNVRYADLFARLQREAREARRGLWR